jgi:uncharacterized protein YegL
MNYDECSSEYPNLSCPATELTVEPCGGPLCSSLVDTSISAVSLPRDVANGLNGNPTDEQVSADISLMIQHMQHLPLTHFIQAIESVCYTRELDNWFQQKRAEDSDFWSNEYNVESPQMFMGTQEGTFRIHPARHSSSCGDFDPRSRPWYIAGSSGPKNVVLILDTSGSMAGLRIELMRQAATRVIETLTIADRIGLVHFSSEATVVTTQMVIASESNKVDLLKKIQDLEAIGKTNFHDAFLDAFEMIDQTTESELHVDCNSAILFLTDGQMTDPDGITEDDVVDLVTSEITRVQDELQKPVLLFTYSISDNDNVHGFPKRLACASDLGVWSQIVDETLIVQSLTSYYRLFALGLGTESNSGFVAWAEPFIFFPSGVLGTTASAPVYDRSKEPPLFIGVVGFAFTLSAIDQALGVETESQETLDRVIRQSTARCPSLNLTLCELESYRGDGSCFSGTTDVSPVCDFVEIEASKCSGTHDYPQNLWANTNWKDLDYADRACCEIGSDTPSNQCAIEPADSSSSNLILPIAIGGSVLAVAIAAFFVWRMRRMRSNKQQQAERDVLAAEQHRPPATAPPEASPTGSADYSESFATIIPPPTDSTFVNEQIQAYHSQTPPTTMRK